MSEMPLGPSFGRHVRSLRQARGMTQEVLAERTKLSPDTIRRLEQGSFSPSLDTLNKLCKGLDIQLSTLFEAYELGERNISRELLDLIVTRSPGILVLAFRMLRTLFTEIDRVIAAAKREAVEAERADAERRERHARAEERDRRDRKHRQEAESRARKEHEGEDPEEKTRDVHRTEDSEQR
jgi:transcriptional regulator with XRE-family HTH domain